MNLNPNYLKTQLQILNIKNMIATLDLDSFIAENRKMGEMAINRGENEIAMQFAFEGAIADVLRQVKAMRATTEIPSCSSAH